MPPTPYRLDTVAASLIERLEGARRTWIGQPEEAQAGMQRIAEDALDRVVREHDEIMGEGSWGTELRRELLETFLPRYVRLATAHNALEADGYGAWRQGDPAARVLGTGIALLAALVLERVLHHPVTLLAFVFALFVPVLPEIRAWHYRRQYTKQLQEVVDDMGRIQAELERYSDDAFTDARPLQDARKKREAAREKSQESTSR